MKQNNLQRINPPLSFPKRLLIAFLRTFYRLLYHQFAWMYDWIASIVSLGTWQDWAESVLPYLDASKTLEIGFGPGHLQVKLHQKGVSVFGLDESPQMIEICRRKINKNGFWPDLVRGDAQFLPYSDESFHQIVMTFPAEFIFTQKSKSEIYRILVKGGKAVILPLAWITGRKPLERFAAWLFLKTGEAPEWNEKYLEPLKKFGFDASWEMINYDSSKILIIQLTKPLNQEE
jgi:ubiquinone/menaquinone biosynthesis C-methylase UbiE